MGDYTLAHFIGATKVSLDTASVPAVLLRNIEGKIFAIPIQEEDLANLEDISKRGTNEYTLAKIVARVIEVLDGKLEAILITELRNGDYVVKMVLRERISGMHKEVEIKPADAISLSLLTGAPIYVSDIVLKAVGVEYSK